MIDTVILILILLLLKHFICDFVLQFPYMLEEKGTYGAAGGIHHAAFHALGTALSLMLLGVMDAIFLALIDFILHYHIDWVKVKLSKGLTSSDRKFWFWFGIDQLLHQLSYLFIIIWIIA
jgi:hypothetical protein